jgi:hypothetical protein
VKYNNNNPNVVAKTFSLTEAQQSLGTGGWNQDQLIVSMAGNIYGDPHDLAKTWPGKICFACFI